MSRVYIYGLINPQTEAIRYVGKTNNPARRLHEHESCTVTFDEAEDWLKELHDQGLGPEMRILEIVEDEVHGRARELYWIKKAINEGAELFNCRGDINTALSIELVRICFYLPTEVQRDFHAACIQSGMTMSDWLRKMVTLRVNRYRGNYPDGTPGRQQGGGEEG